MKKNVLLTGASGFIGKKLAKHLLKEGYSVYALSRNPKADSECTELPCSTYAEIESALKQAKPDVVLHLATLYLAAHRPEEIRSLIDSNIRLGVELVEAMVNTGCLKLINTGTLFQNYANRDYDPYNLYAATKQAFEDCCRHYVSNAKLKALHLKITDSYGPGDTRKKILDLMVDSAMNGKLLELSPGDQYVDPVHVDDLVQAFAVALRDFDALADEKQPERSFRLSTEHPLTLKQLSEKIESVSGKKLNVRWGAKPYRTRENWQPLTRFDRLPGWKNRVALESGIQAAIDALKKAD